MKNKLTIFFYLVLCSFAFTQELVVSQDPQADIVPNVPPQTEERYANIWANDTETTNIQLRASDQDGDALTFTLVTPPTNGTVTITETQTIGIVSQFVASYTPTTAFTSTNAYQDVDSFTFKVNDGNEDSNISTVYIRSFPKNEKHNWTHSFNGNISKTIFDNQGNTYQVGSFTTLTNFVDGTSLDANYTPDISYTDAYIIKLNDSGELLWSKIITGEKSQYLNGILFSNDGNLIATGYTDDIAIFSNGDQLGSEDTDTENDFFVKFNSNSGDILWSVTTEDDPSNNNNNYDIASSFTRNAVLSNGDILFFPYYNYQYELNDPNYYNIHIYKLNSSNGDITTVEYNGDIPARIQVVESDDNDNIYITSQNENNNYQFPSSSLIKYDSNLNILWNMVIDDNGSGNSEARVYDIEYDSTNDLLYVVGQARSANINPLGTSTIVSNNANNGGYFAAYNTDGILQFSHGFETDINSSFYSQGDKTLEIFDNKLVLRSSFNGIIDFDVTDGIFYTPLSGISSGSFLSIYDLTNGLNFTGHYFDQNGLFSGYDIFYKNEKIKVSKVQFSTQNFYDYDGSSWFDPDYIYTNVKTENSQYGSNAGVMEFLLDDENLPNNFAPISEGRYANLWTNNTETTNIQLEASDQDGDALTFT